MFMRLSALPLFVDRASWIIPIMRFAKTLFGDTRRVYHNRQDPKSAVKSSSDQVLRTFLRSVRKTKFWTGHYL